jgi:hypothetical protein
VSRSGGLYEKNMHHSCCEEKGEKCADRYTRQEPVMDRIFRAGRTCNKRPRLLIAIVLMLILLVYVFLRENGSQGVRSQMPVVMVLILDGSANSSGGEMRLLEKILENREQYAAAHGRRFANRKY